MEIRELVERMNGQVESIARHLLPGGKVVGREYEAGDLGGGPGRSLRVCVSGDKRGVWCDFAGHEKGDLLDLWSQARGISLSEAIKEVKAHLGISDPPLMKAAEKKYRRPQQPKASTITETSPVMRYLTRERRLSVEVLERYGVKEAAEVGPWPGWQKQQPFKGPWIVFPFIRSNELVGVKYLHLKRPNGKKVTLVEANCEPTCFGWPAIDPNAREVVICEGEIDAMTMTAYGYPALSVPFGGGKGDKQQWVDCDWDELARFETIYLCMDNDESGKAAVEELQQRLGIHRCRSIVLPYKDVNECAQKGVTKAEIDKCMANATFYEPEALKRPNEFRAEVLDEFYPAGGERPGFSMPWDHIPFRFLRGEVTLITGTNGHGKSLLWNEILLHAAECGERCCIASFEMAPKKTLTRAVKQATAMHTPGKDAIEGCLDFMSDRLWIYNKVGTGKVKEMLEVFEYTYRRHGVKQFLIDSLMKCGIAEDDYREQKAFIEVLCDFAIRTDSHIHLIAHPRKGDDEMSPAKKLDIKGTGAISDLAFNTMSVWRNKKKESLLAAYQEGEPLPGNMTLDSLEAQADAYLFIDKCREDGTWEGRYPLWFHPGCLRYTRKRSEHPKAYYSTRGMQMAQDDPFAGGGEPW